MDKHLEKQAAVVNLGAGPNQVPLIRKAREMGFFVVAVDRARKAPGFHYSDIALRMSTHDKDTVVDELVKLSANYKLQGVIARTTGQALYTASAISRIFSVPGINDVIAKISSEKASMREFLTSHCIPVPKGNKVSPEKPGKLDIPFPLIVKPDFTLTGKKDINLVTNEHSFDNGVVAAARSSENRFVEVEQYIEGIDVSCMFFANKGNAEVIAYWDELVAVMNRGTISGLGVSTPSVIQGTTAEEKIKKIIGKFASIFPDVSAILVLSFRVDFEGNPHVIELHADLTGDLILDILLPASCEKFDPWTLILEVATDRIAHFPSAEFIPTCLYYGNGKGSGKANPFQDHDLIQKPSLKRNLETFSDVMITGNQDIGYPPKHLQWLLENTDNKALI